MQTVTQSMPSLPNMLPFLPPSRHELESQVSMIMLQTPFPPLPLVVIDGNGEEKIGSTHDLLSQAISITLCSQYALKTPSSTDKTDAERIMLRKQQILTELNAKIASTWQLEISKFMQETTGLALEQNNLTQPGIFSHIWKQAWKCIPIQHCYDIYCASFREYMSCYPGSQDLRIYPLSAVFPDTIVYQHAVEHLKARETYIVDTVHDKDPTEDPIQHVDDVDDADNAKTPEDTIDISNHQTNNITIPRVKKDIHTYADMIRLYAMSMFCESNI